MSRSNTLPTFITVANIQDLFWNNNSDLYPTCAPDPAIYIRIEDHFPVFHSPYLGTIILTGEYNHCIYNGVYYFLNKLRVLDVPTEHYEYQLDYDVMMNFLVSGVEVRGTLIKTNREDILEDCLQHTKPILADPIEIKVYDGNKSKKWQDDLELVLPNTDQLKNFQESIIYEQITKEDLDFFVHRINNSVLGQITKNKMWKSGKWQRDQVDPYQLVSPLFIVDYIPTVKHKSIWKSELAARLFSFLGRESKNLVVTKQTTPTGHFNEGRNIVGKANSGLGQNINEDVLLPKIDLSGLVDIVPLNHIDGQPLEPTTTPKYEHLISLDTGAQPIDNVFIELRRRAYLPINNGTENNESCIPKLASSSVDYCGEPLWNGDLPQKVETIDNRIGYLWYLDKNNVPLVRRNGKGRLTEKYKLYSAQYWSSTSQETWWPFWELEYKNIPPIGFILFQLNRPRNNWEDIEFVGTSTNKLSYRTGLNSREFNKYINNDYSQWWSGADGVILRLWGDYSFSRLNLALDGFSWLSIAPSDKDTDYQLYKWYRYSDWFNYHKFFPQYTGRLRFYPSQINKGDISHNNIKVVNRFTNDKVPAYLRDRKELLDKVSIYESVELDKPITRGTIVSTSLEHYWGKVENIDVALPFTLSSNEITRIISAEYNHNLFKGDYHLTKIRSDAEFMHLGKEIGTILLNPYGYYFSELFRYLGWKRKRLDLYTEQNLNEVTSFLTLDSFYNTERVSTGESDKDLPFGVVLYLHKGIYRIGMYEEVFHSDMSLSSNQDNIVRLVDGKKGKQFKTYLIRPIPGDPINFDNTPVISDDDIKNKIIQAAMGNKIHVFDWEDLKTNTQTFDLVGTNWNLIVHNGTFNLFPKDGTNVLVGKTISDVHKFNISSKSSGSISTYSKINQKAELNYYGQVFPLNTKFSFDNDTFTCTITSVEVEQEYADPDVEFKRISVSSPNDQIEVMATLPKKQTRAAAPVDAAQVSLMKEKLLQQTMNYEQDKYASQLLLDDKRLLMARQREDLDFQLKADIGSALIGIGGAGAWMGKRTGGGTDSAAVNYLSKFGTAYAAFSQVKPAIISLIRHPTLLKRVDEDERNLLLANSQQLYQRRQNYEHDFKIQTYKLNKISNSFVKPGVSNRDAQEQFNKLRNIENVNIHVYLPSTEQSTQINHIYSTYGCECIWDKFDGDNPLIIESGMKPGLYRFSKLERGGLLSEITDNTLRNILRQILENGTKFDTCSHRVITRDDTVYTTPIEPSIDFNTDNLHNWQREQWIIYQSETDKPKVLEVINNLPKKGLTDEEWKQHNKDLQDVDDDTLLDRINQIILGRETGQPVVIEKPKEPEKGDSVELNKTISELRSQIIECESREGDLRRLINDLNQQLSGRQNNIDQLNKDKTDLQTQLTECREKVKQLNARVKTQQGNVTTIQGTVTALTLEKEELIKKHKECESTIKRLLAAQATCDRVNTQKIKELEAQIKACRAEKDQNQSELDRVNRELTTKNKELENANKELEKTKNELNTAKADNDAIKAQVTEKDNQLATCQADLTKKEQELRKQIQDLNAQITRNTNQISSLQTKVTNLTNKRNELADQNKKLKEDLSNARSKAQADQQLQTQVADLNKQLEAKDAELEQAHNDCERVKNELRDKQASLESEIHQHKVDKEDLTQQLNNERVRAINEKDEINKLKKQLEDTKGDKDKITELEEELEHLKLEAATCDERIAAKHRELEQCQLELDIARKQPKEPARPTIPDECNLIKTILNEPYSYEMKTRENGFDAFLDLVFDLAQNLTWEGRSRIDQKLFKIPEVVPLLERLEELKNVPIIDKAIDLTKESGYDVFRQWMEQGGDLNGRIPGIVAKYNTIKLMETPTNIHAVKAILDELNWQSYKTKGLLAEQLKTNEDLQFLFTHIYPGTKTLDLYKEIYGDPNVAIIRKRFSEEVQCVPGGGGSALELLDSYRKNVKHTVGDITQPTPKPVVEETQDSDIYYLGANLRIGGAGVENDPLTYVSDLLQRFEDKYFRKWSSEGSGKGVMSAAIESWYRRYIFMNSQSNYEGVDKEGKLVSKGGDYLRLAHMPLAFRKKWNSRRYVDTTKFRNRKRPHMDVINNVEGLLKRLDEMTVDPTFLNKVSDGSVKIYMSIDADLTPEKLPSPVKIEIPQETIAGLQRANLLEKFIKVLLIFDKNNISANDWYKDYTDTYKTVRLFIYLDSDIETYKNIGAGIKSGWNIDIGSLYTPYPSIHNWSDDQDYAVMEGVSKGKIITIRTAVLWSVMSNNIDNPTIDNWYNLKGDISRWGVHNAALKFLRYFYAISNNKTPNWHPWYTNRTSREIKDNPVLCFFESLYEVANY